MELCLTLPPALYPPAPLTSCRCVSGSASMGSPSARTSSTSTSGWSTTAWRKPRWGQQGLWGWSLPWVPCSQGHVLTLTLLCLAGPSACQHAGLFPLPHHHGLPRLPAGEGQWWWPPACDGDVRLVGTSGRGDMRSSPHLGQNLCGSGCRGCKQGMLCQVDGYPTNRGCA